MRRSNLLIPVCSWLLGCGLSTAAKGPTRNDAGDDTGAGGKSVANGAGGRSSRASNGGSSPVGDAASGDSSGATATGNSGVEGAGGAPYTPPRRDAGPSRRPFDLVGIIGTGQSLSLGYYSTAISVTQPFKNVVLLDSGPDPKFPIDGRSSAKWSMVPLIEPMRRAVAGSGPGYDQQINQEYPNNLYHSGDVYGETPHSGMANTISALWAARGESDDYVTAHSVVGLGGTCLSQLGKASGRSFPAALSETRVFKQLADAAGKTYGVAGILLTHGECDAATNNKNYGTQVYQLEQDYDASIRQITGQERHVVLFGSQQSSFNDGYGGTAVQLWRAGVDHPGSIVCTGPKYAYGAYGLHLPAPGYERLGEKYGEVFDLVVNQGIPWKPLGPNKVSRSGATITVDFDVPNPPLVWDEHLTRPHQQAHTAWAQGRGFEVKDDGGNEVSIASVAIQGSRVIATLSAVPAADAKLTLGYALTQDGSGNLGGYDDGLHGQLRDSDAFVGYSLEKIDVKVTNGSSTITASKTGAFARRGSLDIVSGGDLPPDTVASKIAGDQITLSSAWTGASGVTGLTFHHNHYNYCVHFSMPVP